MRINNIKDFIIKAKLIHNEFYNYDESIYVGNKIKIKIKCKYHGIFLQTPHCHLSGRGCRKCANVRMRQRFGKSTEKFILEANIVHSGFYNYDKVLYINRHTNIDIMCPIHGVFSQLPSHHLNYSGCSMCKLSKGEKRISSYLSTNNIEFISQFTFENCRGKKKKLPFDFYLPTYNICIEFDGMQHFSDKHFCFRTNGKINDKFNETVNNDRKKDDYCINNNIKLIRIKYIEMDKIEDILKSALFQNILYF